jgi:hypothetical protein
MSRRRPLAWKMIEDEESIKEKSLEKKPWA